MKGKLLSIGSVLIAVAAWIVDGLVEERRLKEAVEKELDKRGLTETKANDN